jgi:hypothetical protein
VALGFPAHGDAPGRLADKAPGEAEGAVLTSEGLKPERADKRSVLTSGGR